jgi:hypothetical protein
MISPCTDCYSQHYNEMHRCSELLDREVHWNTLVQRTNGRILDHGRCTTCTLYHLIWSYASTWRSDPVQCTYLYQVILSCALGCPRKNQIFFSFRTETQSVSVVFRFVSRNQKNVSVCFGVSDQY